ncbi:MAG: SMC-Scp complex subunit ScpB [bacterium]
MESQPTTTRTVTDIDAIKGCLEAIFFAADEPLTRRQVDDLVPDATPESLERALRQLKLDYSGPSRGIHLVEIAGGFQFRTNPDFNQAVLRLFESKPFRLSKAALETLAIVAYRQPVTRAQVDELRGVDCSAMMKKLNELELIAVVGRMDDIGRPNLYGTTQRFLQFFGLKELSDLPTLDQLEIDFEMILENGAQEEE